MPSTVVANLSYDAIRSSLRVRFISGLVYEYKNVPLEVYQAMKTAGSKGAYLNKYIKGNYDFKKVS